MPFVHLQFLRLDPGFHALQSNEKLMARQHYLAVLESSQKTAALHAYSLTGLRADCDVLLWRVAGDLEPLRETAQRLHASGLGQYLIPVLSYLALSPEGDAADRALSRGDAASEVRWGAAEPGPSRCLFFMTCAKAALPGYRASASRHPSLRLRSFDSLRLDGEELLIACETDQPADFARFLRGLDAEPAPVFPCLRMDVRDLVESLG